MQCSKRTANCTGGFEGGRELIAALGPVSRAEWTVGIVSIITDAPWMARPALARWVPGLSDAGLALAVPLLA